MGTANLFFTDTDRQILAQGFEATFGTAPVRYFSAPGRTEIGGNHTDHQLGRVLAAAVTLDTRAAVRKTGSSLICVQSKGYPLCQIDLSALEPRPAERNTSAALIRGVAAGFCQRGYPVSGFDAYVESTVLPGSGLSSSAAFEVLIGTIMNQLFCNGRISPLEIARISQEAENVYFGKPCGLMDQMTSAAGGLISIDFQQPDKPKVETVQFDFSSSGYALCIIDSGANHADLTDEYAAIPREMKSVSAFFGKAVLSQLEEAEFYAAMPVLRQRCGDRAVLRCIHYYQENARVTQQAAALRAGQFERFLALVQQSGDSSYMNLQNVIPSGSKAHQEIAVALALCRHFLHGAGAFRVHGGGFAGTVQAFVPLELLAQFRSGIDSTLGDGACRVLSIRPHGGVAMEL